MTVQGNLCSEPHVFIGEKLVPKSTVKTLLAVSFFTEYIMRTKICEFTLFLNLPIPKIDTYFRNKIVSSLR